jgi:hypothetical protein
MVIKVNVIEEAHLQAQLAIKLISKWRYIRLVCIILNWSCLQTCRLVTNAPLTLHLSFR